jgi:hypothetical protein
MEGGEDVLLNDFEKQNKKYNSGWTTKKEVESQRKENKKVQKEGPKRKRTTRRRSS